jgi:hypothetical protein
VPAGSPAGAHAAAPAQAGSPTVKQQPAITTRTDTETREIPFTTRLVRDPTMPRGTRLVQTPGVAGEQTLRYLVTLTGGQQTDRRLLGSTVTRPPQPQIVAIGDASDQGFGLGPGGSGHWQGSGGGHRRHCGPTLDFCMPLGRGESCPDDDGGDQESQQLGDADADSSGGDVALSGNDIDVLGGKTC